MYNSNGPDGLSLLGGSWDRIGLELEDFDGGLLLGVIFCILG